MTTTPALDLDKLFGQSTEDSTELGGDDLFPTSVILLSLGGGKYRAVNATVPDPVDPKAYGFIATFASEEDVKSFQTIIAPGGESITMSFEEARQIAVNKAQDKGTNIFGLALQKEGKSVVLHWVK